MRLADLLSKDINSEYVQVEGFLKNKPLATNKQRKLNVGRVILNFFCKNCNDTRTFISDETLYCVGVDKNHISIDCVLCCSGCNALLPMWFLIESKLPNEDGKNDKSYIYDSAPYLRIIKRVQKRTTDIIFNNDYDVFSELIDKAEEAYKNELGAGAIVYLRIVLEQVVKNVANEVGISTQNGNKKRKQFKDLLKEVDEKCHIVPIEFSKDQYRLFGDLSECIHGNCDETTSLKKYSPLKILVTGIINKIRKNQEIISALDALNWCFGGNSEQ